MPNRILREGILTSETVNTLRPHAELFYRRLMSVVDDYGRYFASAKLLRPACYPLQIDRVREADISCWVAECVLAGLILLYTVDGKEYLVVQKTDQPRAKSSKFPAPPAGAPPCSHVRADADTCKHVRPDSYSGSDSSSNADSISKETSNEVSCTEPAKPTPVLTFPTAGPVKEWHLLEVKAAEYRETYPGLDLITEMKKALQWCRDNPTKRKTPTGMPRFLGNWLDRAQNDASKRTPTAGQRNGYAKQHANNGIPEQLAI